MSSEAVVVLIGIGIASFIAFKIYLMGKNKGHKEGFQKGHSRGQSVGHKTGYTIGQKKGYTKGKRTGSKKGYYAGKKDGSKYNKAKTKGTDSSSGKLIGSIFIVLIIILYVVLKAG